MDRFVMAQQVAERMPQMQIVVVTAKGVNNKGHNKEVERFADVSIKDQCTKCESWCS